MAAALRAKSTDLIGLGRPLTAEPDLCAPLIAGKTAEAKKNLVPAALQTGSSIVQILELAKGEKVSDFGVAEVAEETVKVLLAGGE